MPMSPRPPLPGHTPSEIAIDAIRTHRDHGGRAAAAVSAVALIFSGYSLWESSLKSPDIRAYVPPVIQYSSPYQNTNFEVFAVPVTFSNSGGQTGTALALDLEVTNLKTKATKRFMASDFGTWTMDKSRAFAFQPFAPISLSGRESRTETVLFYPVNGDEKPEQLVTEPGMFQFKLVVHQTGEDGWGTVEKSWRSSPLSLSFERELRYYDARAFQNGTLPLYAVAPAEKKSGTPQ